MTRRSPRPRRDTAAIKIAGKDRASPAPGEQKASCEPIIDLGIAMTIYGLDASGNLIEIDGSKMRAVDKFLAGEAIWPTEQ